MPGCVQGTFRRILAVVLDEQLRGAARIVADLVAVRVTARAMGSVSVHDEERAGMVDDDSSDVAAVTMVVVMRSKVELHVGSTS
mmetsp:Transcript_45737/g.97253  ORF Transcript_45737/g.97253 Transcript_45737/m.97253 type:complete len:84 (-) Transcript_45737:71-322(-)